MAEGANMIKADLQMELMCLSNESFKNVSANF